MVMPSAVATAVGKVKEELGRAERANWASVEAGLGKAKADLAALSVDAAGEAEAKAAMREVLELGVQSAALQGNLALFHKQMDQLKASYEDCAEAVAKGKLPESAQRAHLLGLNLMALLCEGKMGRFHLELAGMAAEEVSSSPALSWPVRLENALSVGAYRRVFASKDSMPSPNFRPFFAILLDWVRKDIASCFEAAYESLAKAETARMLFLTEDEVVDLAASRGWTIRNDRVLTGLNAAAPRRPKATPAFLTHTNTLLAVASALDKML